MAEADMYQGLEKKSLAFKLMQTMGWKEGQGLGAQKQGITEHVRVKKKFDALGVGAAEKTEKLRDWTVGMVGFDQILSGLKEVKAAPRVEEEEEEEEEEDEDEEPKKVKGKSKKEKAKEKEDKKKAEEEVSKAKLATHVGRYHKRENAKRVRAYSSEDLAAILGSVPGGSQPTAEDDGLFMKEVRAEAQEDSEVSSSGHMSDQEPAPAGKKAKKLSSKEEEEVSVVKSWWMGLFVRAGKMGSTRKELKSKKVTAKAGFSEKDQENLYSDVHNHATHGKQGLGIGDAPRKVAGARWQGTKTKLDSDDEEEKGTDQEDEEASSEEEDTGIVVLSAKKPAQIDHPAAPEEKKKKKEKPKSSEVDIEETAVKILKAEKMKSLPLKELKARYLIAAGLSKEDSKKPVRQMVKAIKSNTKRFQIDGKRVVLLKS